MSRSRVVIVLVAQALLAQACATSTGEPVAKLQTRKADAAKRQEVKGRAEVIGDLPQVVGTEALKPLSKCGSERWPVKTLSDKKVGSIDFKNMHKTTISALNQITGHCNTGMTLGRTYSEEFQVHELRGFVIFVRHEDDQDFHIAVREDENEESPTMIVEVVDPGCNGARDSSELSRLQAAHDQLMEISSNDPTTLEGQWIRVRGVGFFDRAHGQVGLAESCIELHPVLEITAE